MATPTITDARLAEIATDAQTSAASAGEAIRHSPDHEDPADAEVYLEDVEVCMTDVLGGWTGAEFLVWRAAFVLACRADENVQASLAGIINGSYYLVLEGEE